MRTLPCGAGDGAQVVEHQVHRIAHMLMRRHRKSRKKQKTGAGCVVATKEPTTHPRHSPGQYLTRPSDAAADDDFFVPVSCMMRIAAAVLRAAARLLESTPLWALVAVLVMVLLVVLTGESIRERFEATARPGLQDGHKRVPTTPQPFGVVFSKDGRYLFVGGNTGLHVYDSNMKLARHLQLSYPVRGIALSGDGRLLALAIEFGVQLVDVQALVAGEDWPQRGIVVTRSSATAKTGTLELTFSSDDSMVVATGEFGGQVDFIDVKSFVKGKQVLGSRGSRIKTGVHPVGIVAKGDKVLYTVQGSAKKCNGNLVVADVRKKAKVKAEPVGCVPVRVETTDSKTFVTVRGDNSVAVLDTAKLLDPSVAPGGAKIKSVAVGPKPVGLKTAMGGKYLVVACSNRDTGKPGRIDIIDTSTLAVVKSIPTLMFPRNVAVSPDGNTVVVTLHGSAQLDVLRMPVLMG